MESPKPPRLSPEGEPKDVEDAFHVEYTHDDVFGEITEEGPNYRNVHSSHCVQRFSMAQITER